MSDVSDQQEDLAPTVKTVNFANKSLSLTKQKASLILPPFSEETTATQLEQPVQLNPAESPQLSASSTSYLGRIAQNIQWEIAQPISLLGNSEYAYPINVYEDGQIVHFTVSVNDPSISIVCIVYDDRQRASTICNDTPRDLVRKGRGMTLAQALTRDQYNVSVDFHGTPHAAMPYVSRYFDTFSAGSNYPDDYDDVAGTENDRTYIIEYAPAIPRAYKKLYFNIQNKGINTRMIQYAILTRYSFIDRYDYGPIPTLQSDIETQGQGQGNQPAKVSL